MGFSHFFKTLDYFGVQTNFNFKSQKYYRSTYGGFIFFIYIIICVTYIAYTFTLFLQKKHMTVIFYDKELFSTDDIYFHEHDSSFAIDLVCDNYDGKYGDIHTIFEIEANHVQYLRINGETKKNKIILPFHKCTYNDFYNKFNEELDRNEITNKFNCIEDNNYAIKGIYPEEDFEYYELTLSANLKNEFNDSKYLDMLCEYDCKFDLYYIDNAIDVANVTKPKTSFLNSKFIQISPDVYKKVNLYYTIKNFKSDENWFFTMPKENNYLAFSFFEEYDVYKGQNRFTSLPEDYEKFAKYFLRASTTRNIIERRYEKFTEFVASSTSILSAVLLVLVSIISRINDYLSSKEIIDTLCDAQKRNLNDKIILKTKFNNSRFLNMIKKQKNLNILKNEDFNSINENEKELYKIKGFNINENNKNQIQKTSFSQSVKSLVRSDNNNYCDNTQSKINISNNLGMLNEKKLNFKKNNYLINENLDEEKNKSHNISNDPENNYCSNDSNFYKNLKISGIYNKIIDKFEDTNNNNEKCKYKDEQKKIGTIMKNSPNKILDSNSNKTYDEKVKDKFDILNNNIKSSIIYYKFCRFHWLCKRNYTKCDSALENSLNYLTKSLDIFTYLKAIKNQDMFINILFDSENYDLFKKLESLHFNSNNIFDNDNIYKINKGTKRESNINYLDEFCKPFTHLIKKNNKTQIERRFLDQIIKEINSV